MVKIEAVLPHSMAAGSPIQAGDRLVSVNGHEIRDVLDYRFYMAEKHVRLVLKRGADTYETEFSKMVYDDIGLEFETPLMDKKMRCANACVFCFVDQLPGGMRQSLYFKDDDSRLSFLHGNYITMTNLDDRDIDRIAEMHLSPINISIHTTNPELRVRMMKNKNAARILTDMHKLADAGITLCGQIVLCKGLNDGAELDRTMNDLAELVPHLQSVSVVPVGLTKYRERLYPLELFTPKECGEVIDQVSSFADRCMEKFGSRVFFCSDEFYITAGRPLPSADYYEGYPQIENGVGMLTSFTDEFCDELDRLMAQTAEGRHPLSSPRRVTVATGVAAYLTMRSLAEKAEAAFPGLSADVVGIINRFFGETITVSGLLTGKDMTEQLRDRDLGEALLIPASTLRAERDMFLDNMTPDQMSGILGGIRIIPTENDGGSFLRNLLGLEE
ncbi:MAG: DUF512 domain-containing protein [Clostridia bacterium]|nr:DUF512 domain-containing protein [Clostridia bacterium]